MTKKFILMLIFLLTLLTKGFLSDTLALDQNTDFLLQDEQLLLSRVNFKNSDRDWLEIYYYSPTQKPLNLKGLQFEDDKIFKKIETDMIVGSGDFIKLVFKSTGTDDDKKHLLYTDHSGLTATTEQIVMKDPAGNILDSVCWTSSKPTTSEKKELEELFEKKAWNSSDPQSCIQSEKVTKEMSIIRTDVMKDTDSNLDWKVEEPQSKINEKTSSTSKKTTKQQYQNGDLSKTVFINEILPYAQKDDTQNEWIELYNEGNKNINLGNWSLDDEEGGSKPYKIPDSMIIKAKSYLLFPRTRSKLALANKGGKIRLFDPQGKLQQTISYKDAPKGNSFSRIILHKQDHSREIQWIWSFNPTPSAKNPDHEEFTGTIMQDAEMKTKYFFLFQTNNRQTKKIFFEELLIPGPLAKSSFIKNTKMKIQVATVVNEKNAYVLQKYEILETAQKNSKTIPSYLTIIFVGTLLSGGAGLWVFYKKTRIK
jgi:hypothetical protein